MKDPVCCAVTSLVLKDVYIKEDEFIMENLLLFDQFMIQNKRFKQKLKIILSFYKHFTLTENIKEQN